MVESQKRNNNYKARKAEASSKKFNQRNRDEEFQYQRKRAAEKAKSPSIWKDAAKSFSQGFNSGPKLNNYGANIKNSKAYHAGVNKAKSEQKRRNAQRAKSRSGYKRKSYVKSKSKPSGAIAECPIEINRETPDNGKYCISKRVSSKKNGCNELRETADYMFAKNKHCDMLYSKQLQQKKRKTCQYLNMSNFREGSCFCGTTKDKKHHSCQLYVFTSCEDSLVKYKNKKTENYSKSENEGTGFDNGFKSKSKSSGKYDKCEPRKGCCYTVGYSDKSYGTALEMAKKSARGVCNDYCGKVPYNYSDIPNKGPGFRYKLRLNFNCKAPL